MSKDKCIISDDKIQREIKNGKFKEDGILIREVSTGKIVKIMKNDNTSESIFPQTFIQINDTYIYQTDINKIITEIINIKNNENLHKLEKEYKTNNYDNFTEYKINISLKNQSSHYKPEITNKTLADDLFHILENLNRLKNIQNEISNVSTNDLTLEKISLYNDSKNKESYLLSLNINT